MQKIPQHRGSLAHTIRQLAVLSSLLATGLSPGLHAAVEIEEMVVTGEGVGSLRLQATNGAGSRLGLSSFDTPASVDLISREEIATKGDYDALAAITRSTGISASANPGNGGTSVSARGFNGHNSTTYTYDGTRLYISAGTVTFPADTWTLERVEVLRGAGSVVNGVGAIGATINYIPRAPEPGQRSFDALIAAGSFDMHRVALGGGADLSEDWAFRLDGSFQDENSNVDRNSEQRKVLAGSLLFHPGDDFSMKFSLDYADISEDSPYFGTPLIGGEASDSHRRNNYNFADGFLEYEDLWARVRTQWRLAPGITLRNDTYLLDAERQWQNLESYAWNEATGLIDRDGFSYYGIIHDQRQVGTRGDILLDTELAGMSNRLSIGADVNSIDLDYHNNWSEGMFYAGNSVPVFGFVPDTLADAGIPTVLAYSTDTTQFGLFLDNVLQLNEQWSLVMGARYDDIDFSRDNHALAGNPASSFTADFSEFTWRTGLVYQPLDNLSLYAQYSRATDPLTSPVSMSAGFSNWDLSRGRQFEVGIKQQFMDSRAEYTLAWFDITKTDLLTRQPGSMVDEQIGQQSSEGLEFTFRISPSDMLSVDINATWVDAAYDDFFSGGVSLAGNTPRNVPETTANAWLNWAPLSRLQLGAGLRYVDSRYTDDANSSVLPSYTVLDASARWDVNAETQVILRARNLGDEENHVLSQYGTDQWVFADPRSYELSIRYAM